MRVFLSGAIQDVADLGSGWRALAAPQLIAAGYDIVNPVVDPEKQVLFGNEVVHRNLALQKTCDLLLVEYSLPNRCYVGTDYELTMAREVFRQPTIVWAHEMYCERVYLQYLASAILPTLDDAIDYLLAFYPS